MTRKEQIIQATKQEETVSEAAENFANEFEKKMATPHNPCLDEITLHWLRLAFKAGVKWQKEQDDVTKETLCKELEEEIKRYFKENWKDMEDGDPLASKILSELTEIAKHFSEWQKKKMSTTAKLKI